MDEKENGDEEMPRATKIVKTLLKSMGVSEYEPRIIHQFLELWYRYVVDVLIDAQVYSEHAAKPVIDPDDTNFGFLQPPLREVKTGLAPNHPHLILGRGVKCTW
ncbi:hypothetical protein MKW94_026889 [Papaver nudicaule]|uniref:Transcription initiation factor TFIID subunit 9 n=1 Tax=Papaver nudicaule TaxID=74823 RepID=A0AA41SFX6_PAPNU|nr:hypothetical protein [Papaver nudicaule]